MKKQISGMKIPPFSKKHSSSSNNKNSNSTRSINTSQTEEVGLQSSYIQSQIQIQKERGNWHVDLTNVLQDDDDNEELRRHSSDQAVNSEDDYSDEEEISIASELQRLNNNTSSSGSDGKSKSEYITSSTTITTEDTTTIIIPKHNRLNPSLRSNPLSNSLTMNKRNNKAPNVMKRCLSDISLVDMLKIQSIDEKNEFKNDDINHLDLEETVLLKQQSSGSKDISLTESEVDKIESLCNSEREDEVSDSSEEEEEDVLDSSSKDEEVLWKAVGATAALIPSPLEKRVFVDPLRGGGTKLEEEEEVLRSPAKSLELLDTSFDPPPSIKDSQQQEEHHQNEANNNGMGERRGSFLPTPFPISQEDLTIIKQQQQPSSTTHTHQEQQQRRNSYRSQTPDDTFFLQSISSRGSSPDDDDKNDGDFDYYSVNSDEGGRGSGQNEVSESGRDEDTNGENRDEQVRLTNNSTSRQETNPSPEDDSDESSIDLAFATDRKETEQEDKWESIRLQRQRRRSSQSGSATSPKQPKRQSVSTVAATVGSDYSAFEAASPSTRYKPRTQSNSQHKNEQEDSDDDDISVSSSGSSYSIVSGMKSRFEQFYNNNFGSTFKGVSTKSLYGASRDPLDVSQTSNYTNESMRSDDDDSESSDSDDDDEGLPNDILSEGEYYVAMSMLIYIYALLRETSLLGHTDIDFDEVDVNSFQSDPGFFSGSHHSTTKFLDKTKSSGFIIRVVMDELEKKEAFSSVEKSDMCVLKEFKQWVNDSRSKQLDAATEQTIKDLRSKIARRRWKRAINAVRLMVRLGHSDSNNFSVQLTAKRRESLRMGGINSHRPYSRRTLGGLGEVGNDGLPQREAAQSRPRVKLRALAGSMMWMHNQREAIMNNFGITNQSESQESLTQAQKRNSLVDKNEIKEIINDALEEPRFFIEGSLLSNLIESGIEVVWFGDRHPNDVVYAICVNRQSKRVSVVFRGTVTSHNWMMNLKLQLSEHPNPITEDYPGRAETLGLHTGFSLYMTRQRKDDSLTKIEEIFSNIDSIGRELAPDGDYELSITGHSLGGALATILSFYAATSNIFSRVKAIKVFTYAAPRVGCQRFLYAYQHLEKIGKLRHARFTNTRDFVPLVPFHGVTRSYKHVGMHIKLLGTDKIAQYWLRQALDVTYPRYHDGLSQLLRIWQVNVIRNINTPRGYKRNHTLTEYQRRIRFSIQYRSMLAQAQGSMVDTKRSRLKTLDEYYYIKGACQMSGTGELTRIALENRAKEGVRREARKKLLVLLAIVILEAVILLGILSHSVPCENYPMALYPLLLITGCRKGESKEVTHPHVLHFDKKNQSLAEEQVNSLLNNNSSKVRQPSKTERPEAETIRAPSPKERRSWASTLTDWLWIWKPHRHSRDDVPPCVWGRCDNNYLPWGVMPRSLVLPLSIVDSSTTKDSSDMNED